MIRFVEFAAKQLAVLVGLEVGETDDHRVRPECGGDGGDPLDQFLDEESLRRGVAPGAALDFLALRCRQAVDIEDRLRVNPDNVVDDEFDAGEADTGVWQLGAFVMALARRKLELRLLKEALENTTKLAVFVLFILIGSTVFSFTFNAADGHIFIEHLFSKLPGGAMGFLIVLSRSV